MKSATGIPVPMTARERFLKGRPKGSITEATLLRREILDLFGDLPQKAVKRLRSIIDSGSDRQAIAATRLIMEYCYGRPTEKSETEWVDNQLAILVRHINRVGPDSA